jgi:uncharacterized protein (DUF169 family)
MDQTYAALSAELSDILRLASPPLGIAFRAERDVAGVERYRSDPPAAAPDGRTGAVPAGCVFWFRATDRAFSTIAEDHANCSVGSYTHGFRTLQEVADKGDVAAIVEVGWVSPTDFPNVPAVSERPGSVVYGPLADMPVEPDVVFIRLNPKQAMLMHDAVPTIRFEGKPQCHIVPMAKDGGVTAISVGCMLSRVRTGMSNNEMTCAIPAARLGEIVEALRRNAGIDRAVAEYAAADASRFIRPMA